MLAAIIGADRAGLDAVVAVFRDSIAVVALFLFVAHAVTAHVGHAGLFGAVRRTHCALG